MSEREEYLASMSNRRTYVPHEYIAPDTSLYNFGIPHDQIQSTDNQYHDQTSQSQTIYNPATRYGTSDQVNLSQDGIITINARPPHIAAHAQPRTGPRPHPSYSREAHEKQDQIDMLLMKKRKAKDNLTATMRMAPDNPRMYLDLEREVGVIDGRIAELWREIAELRGGANDEMRSKGYEVDPGHARAVKCNPYEEFRNEYH